MALLEVRDLRARYGEIEAIRGIELEVERGAVVALLGANGAGKTSTLRAVTGMVKTSGSVRFDGKAIAGSAPEDAARRGIAHVPEGRGTLGGGEQQMLAIARALMMEPQLLLLDEPSLGLAPKIVREIFELLRTINRDAGVSILVAEQNATVALACADYAYVLETGRIATSGPSKELVENDRIRRIFLGY